jgi:hypothetical protein
MSNVFKYNTGTETQALNVGNWWIGTGDVGKGPTNVTGFYNGISPFAGGYVIYLNKSSQGPVIYSCQEDSELVDITNKISGNSYSTVTQCLSYFSSQTDKVCVNMDYENVTTDGMVMCLDALYAPSYPRTGTGWTNLSGNGANAALANGASWSSSGYMSTDGVNDRIDVVRPWSPNLATDYYTIEVWFRPNALPSAQFSTNSPVFGARIGSDYMIFLYPAVNGQSKMGVSYDDSRYTSAHQSTATISSNEWVQFVHVGIPYVENGYNRGKLKYYVNGALDRGTFTSSDSNGYGIPNPFYVGYDARWGAYSNLDMAIIRVYNRELSATEILNNFNAQKNRFGL